MSLHDARTTNRKSHPDYERLFDIVFAVKMKRYLSAVQKLNADG